MRYVERDPLRAGLVERAEDWAWGSLAWRHRGDWQELLATPPLALPSTWLTWVNAPQTREELSELRACVNHQRPCGNDLWTSSERERRAPQVAKRRRGRPSRVADGRSSPAAVDAGQQAVLQLLDG
jgi:putative transposase